MYDYCNLGWPTNIPDISALGIVVYPNPTRNTLTIETRLEIEIEVYDLMGKLLIKTKNVNRLDLSDLTDGLYNLTIIHKDKPYNKQIIKH
jgi:bifunctional DNA-binding transcriptional regulator/antitoxin component of YhaV-PrlF toxin-antitoxin module